MSSVSDFTVSSFFCTFAAVNNYYEPYTINNTVLINVFAVVMFR